MQRLLSKLKSMEDAENVVFFREAWKLADKLMSLDDHNMWKVIQGVWVEMLTASPLVDIEDTCTPRLWAQVGSCCPMSGS
jgi:hypothetical protein